jgi:ribosomal protein S12 methylthiotransferase accessory factor
MSPVSQTCADSTRNKRAFASLAGLVDEYVGLIHSVACQPIRPEDPQFFHYTGTIADLSRITGAEADQLGGGTGLSADEARMKAISEAVERYCANMYSPEEILVATLNEVAEWGVDPRRCALFHAEQYAAPEFPFTPLTANTRLVWAPGFSLTRNEPTWTPLSLIAMRHAWNDQEQPFDFAPVSGYACGLSLSDALVRGICEVIERDSLMLNWYNLIPAPRVDLESLPSVTLKRVLDRFRFCPAQIHCSDLTTDIGVPTYLAMMLSEDESWPAVVVGTATDLDPVRALEHALFEVAANNLLIRSLLSNSYKVPRAVSDIQSQEAQTLFYVDHTRLPLVDHLLSGRLVQLTPYSDAINDHSEDVQTLVAKLAEGGFEVVYADLTTPDVAQFGFKVVKVIIPGMQPLDFGALTRHLGSKRLYDAPKRMGYDIEYKHPDELNRFPSPIA